LGIETRRLFWDFLEDLKLISAAAACYGVIARKSLEFWDDKDKGRRKTEIGRKSAS